MLDSLALIVAEGDIWRNQGEEGRRAGCHASGTRNASGTPNGVGNGGEGQTCEAVSCPSSFILLLLLFVVIRVLIFT